MTEKDRGRILVADEDEAGSRLLTAYLLSAGHDVVTAAGPAEAPGCVQGDRFDLLLLGCSPERLAELESEIRSAVEGRRPSIMLVCSDSIDDRISGKESGVDDLIVRPFTRSELLLRVRSLLRLERLRAELETMRGELERAKAAC